MKRRIVEDLKQLPVSWGPSQYSIVDAPHFPDVVWCVNGYFIAIDIIDPTGTNIPIKKQQRANKVGNASGYHYFVNDDNWNAILERISEI